MNQDPPRPGRADLLGLFPNARILTVPLAALNIQILGCSLLFTVLAGFLYGPSRDLRSASIEQYGSLPALAVFTTDSPMDDAADVLNLSRRWEENLPRLTVHLLLLACACTVVSRFAARRIFRSETPSVVECLRHTVRSWRSILQAILIGGCMLLVLRISLWLMLLAAGLLGASSVAAPAGALAFTVLMIIAILAVGLGCVAVGYDECSGAEGVSRGLSYVLSRPGVAVLMVTCTAILSRLVAFVAYTLMESSRGDFVDRAAPWNASIILNSLQLAVWLCGIAVTYVRLREEVDGVPESELSRQG